MKREDYLNAALLVVALGASVVAAGSGNGSAGLVPRVEASLTSSDQPRLPSAVSDASGVAIPARAYGRVLSLSTLSDGILWQLCESERVVGFTALSQRNPSLGYRYRGKPGFETAGDTERVLGLRPDLVVLSSGGNSELVDRLRRVGLNVFDLGQLRGMVTFLSSIEQLATLIGEPERAKGLLREISGRRQALAARASGASRARALYVAVYGDKMYGGTRGTSFGDVLGLSGLDDLAAAKFSGWPQYNAEQLLALDPDLIVTHQHMSEQFCRQPGLARLKPCRGLGRIIELDDAILSDPGLGMLDSAELILDEIQGQPL